MTTLQSTNKIVIAAGWGADLTVVWLDSSVTASAAGLLPGEQVNLVDEALSRKSEVPAFLALHHPPIDPRIPFLDRMRLSNGDELIAILDRHKNVLRVLAGHVHSPVIAPVSSTILAPAASTHYASGVALNAGMPHCVAEPTSVLVHVECGGRWITHTISAGHAASAIVCFWPSPQTIGAVHGSPVGLRPYEAYGDR